MTESSANKIISKLQELGRSLVYTKNKNVLKTLSCGHLMVISKRSKETISLLFIVN